MLENSSEKWRILYSTESLIGYKLTAHYINYESDCHRFMKHWEKVGWGEEEVKENQEGKVKTCCF